MNNAAGYVALYAMHAFWMVPLLAAVGWGASRMVSRLGPGAQYRVWGMTLALSVAAPLFAISRMASGWGRVANAGHGSVSVVLLPIEGWETAASRMTAMPARVALAACLIYIAVAVFFAGRLLWSLYWTRQLFRESAPVTLKPEYEAMVRRCTRLFSAGEVLVRNSSGIDGPVTLGWTAPVLLLPEGFEERCTPEEFLTAVAHECAHIRRGDFRKNLIHEVLSVAIAFHPVTWILRSRIAETREMVCDAMAIEQAIEPQVYQRSLLRLAAMISSAPKAVPYHAIGIFDANALEKRLMNIGIKRQRMSLWMRCGVMIPAAAILFSVAGAGAAVGAAMRPDLQAADAAKPYGEVYRVGKDVRAPILVWNTEPEFPAAEKGKKDMFAGVCVVEMIVDKKGVPQEVHAVKSLRADFDSAAVDAVKQYRFKPGVRAGEPVAVAMRVEVNFRRF